MATWPDSKYKRILVLASLMEGMVMKEKAASACFMDLSLVPAIPEARVLTCLTREDCTMSRWEYLFLR